MRQFSTVYKTRFDRAFRTDLSHVIMHIILYAILAWLISSVFSNRRKLVSPIKVGLIALGISLLQETIQLVSIKCPVGWDDLFDILVDISGALIGIFVFRWQKQKFTTEDTKSLGR